MKQVCKILKTSRVSTEGLPSVPLLTESNVSGISCKISFACCARSLNRAKMERQNLRVSTEGLPSVLWLIESNFSGISSVIFHLLGP
jgi:hypothetical protein